MYKTRNERARVVMTIHIGASRETRRGVSKGGGGFLGPIISDVRDHHIDNFRFPIL